MPTLACWAAFGKWTISPTPTLPTMWKKIGALFSEIQSQFGDRARFWSWESAATGCLCRSSPRLQAVRGNYLHSLRPTRAGTGRNSARNWQHRRLVFPPSLSAIPGRRWRCARSIRRADDVIILTGSTLQGSSRHSIPTPTCAT